MDTIEILEPSKFRALVVFNVVMLVGWTLVVPVILFAWFAFIEFFSYGQSEFSVDYYWVVMELWLKGGAALAVLISCMILISRGRGIDITDYGMKTDYRSERYGFFSMFLGKRHLVLKGQNVPQDPGFQSYLSSWVGKRIVMGADGKGFCFNEFHFNKDQRTIIKAKLKEFYNLDLLTRSP